jgi:predicted ATPase/class 3 adenylate cyclase
MRRGTRREASVDIAAWLHSLGMQQYDQAFRDNAIDAAVLPELTADDLRDLGVSLVGHRRKLLAAIAALRRDVAPAPETVGVAPVAERRQLTVMFCDLVGSTALAARLDPEDLRDVIAAYHRAVAELIARFGGFVARYMGDGVLAYFGYPQAHEDDAERAVRAGLAAVEAIRELPISEPLQVRIGLATGLSVVGDLIGAGAAQEQAVVGETPNLAARLQALAEPGTIVVADSTRRLLGGLFKYQSLGEVEVKGLAARLPAYRVLGDSRIESRFEALRSGETPLVGRAEEIALLQRRWAQAKAGSGCVVLISAEPGIGKSRLTEAFRQSVAGEPLTRLRYFCSPHHRDSALVPIIGQLERAAALDGGDPPDVKLGKLEALVATGKPAEGDIPLLAGLLSLPCEGRYPVVELSPPRKKEKTFEALLRHFTNLARQKPVLMVFEDLQWADPTTRELLDLTVKQVERLAVLLIATFRPEFNPAWTGEPHVTTLSLRRLERDESDQLVRGIIGGSPALSSAVVDDIVERTDGVPLFIEELTKAVLETAHVGAVPAVSLAVPATLHASLLARLDRLGLMAKEIAQVGAAIGREFSHELLAATVRWSEAKLQAALGRLVDAGLVFQRGLPPQATFLFKHALVQDTAYSTLLRGTRQALHAKIAHVLEQQFPGVAETQPAVLAHHLTEARMLEQAVAYWVRAGQHSAARSAMAEAEAQLKRGLQLLSELPHSRERKRQELDLQVTLASALRESKGHAHPAVSDVLGRALSLIVETETMGTTLHFSVLYGLWVAQYLGGTPVAALEQAQQFLSLTQSQTQSGLLLVGHRLVGSALALTGSYPAALSHLDRAVALYRPEEHRELAFRFGADIGITAQCGRALALWHCGYPDQALRALDEGVRRARQSVHRHTLAYALIYKGLTAISARWAEETEEAANELVSLTREHGFALFLGYGLLLQAAAMTLRGQGEAAVGRIREGVAIMQATGVSRSEPMVLGCLAEALALTGAIAEGLRTLAASLAAAEASSAHWADAELYRLRGDLLGRLPSTDWTEVETCFRTALSVAREQGTRGFELRAAVSLAGLLSAQGRRDEARELLAPVYGWFTEGFNTTDLREAKALL